MLDPRFEKDEGFSCWYADGAKWNASWHAHPEMELVLIVSGQGRLLIGNRIVSFQEKDLFILGSNLPHAWLKDQDSVVTAVVIHAHEEFSGNDFLSKPGMEKLRYFLGQSAGGILIRGVKRRNLVYRFRRLLDHPSAQRFLFFF